MAGAAGMFIVGLGFLLAFLGPLIAIGLLIYAVCTKHPRRGYIASLIALSLAGASVILALPIASLFLYGPSAHGRPPDAGAIGTTVVLIGFQALVVLASLLQTLRKRARCRMEGAAAQSRQG